MSLDEARRLDAADPLKAFRSRFRVPEGKAYLAGNSLGLQPVKAREYVDAELEDWARLGVDGHLEARHPWLPYHENATEAMARVVGAKPAEVVVMNTLTVNLHLMMVSFYRPAKARFKILLEDDAFPSDRYAALSQARFHGFDGEAALIEPEHEAILETIEREGDSIALVLIGGVNYLTGRAFDLEAIAAAARKKGCAVGFDLAHGAGNLTLALHDSGADFAVWCGYKYLNAGPGGPAGCFVHERHARAALPRFEGWWGTNKRERFLMKPEFDALPGAEGWQLSNPPILPLASLRASLEIFDEAGMAALGKKRDALTAYLESELKALPGVEIVTPKARGSQLSLRVREPRAPLMRRLEAAGVVADFREPDIVRAAPVPLYNRFEDCFRFVQALAGKKAAIA
jgi:kynureninase